MGQLAQSGPRVDVLSASLSESAGSPASLDTLASVEFAAPAASTGDAAASRGASIAGPIAAGSRPFEPPSEDPTRPTLPEPRQPAGTKTTARSRKPLRGEQAAALATTVHAGSRACRQSPALPMLKHVDNAKRRPRESTVSRSDLGCRHGHFPGCAQNLGPSLHAGELLLLGHREINIPPGGPMNPSRCQRRARGKDGP